MGFTKEWYKTHEHLKGMLGKHHTEETKKIISDANKGHISWNKIDIPYVILYQKYIVEKKTTIEIAKEYNVCRETIRKKLRRFNIVRRKNYDYKTNKGRKYPKETYPNYGMRNKHHSEDTKESLSQKTKEQWQNSWYKEKMTNFLKQTPPALGKKRPEWSEVMKQKWLDPNSKDKIIKALLKGLIKRPTKPEQDIIDLIRTNNLPVVYTGNGQVLIEGFNPDFMDNNGSKKIIEVFGEYHHNLPKMIKQDKRKLEVYSRLGFDTLIIWSKETKNKELVLEKINKFLKR